jgi:antitoxin VapB
VYIPQGYTTDSAVEKASIFKSNKSQAVRLPKAVALPDEVKRVDIVAIGNTRIITPEGRAWEDWFDGETVSDDFMVGRDQPLEQQREGF